MIAHTSSLEHGALIAVALTSIVLYLTGWFRMPRASSWRLVAWCVGVSTLLTSVLPIMERWAHESFTGHMVQHLVMIVVAAPLLVVAKPVVTFRALPVRAVRVTPAERAIARRWRTHGAIGAAAAFVLVLYTTHLTTIYDTALRNRFVHDVEHVAYLASAIALWAALRSAGRTAVAERVGAVFAVIAGSALLGVVLLSASNPLVPTYAAELGQAEALDDQRTAAALMWVGGMATTLPLLIISVWSWASAEERVAVQAESMRATRSR